MKGKFLALGIVGTLVVLAFLGGPFYIIDQQEQAVVTRFENPVKVILNPLDIEGKEETLTTLRQKYEEEGISFSEGPGLRIKIPWIDAVKRYDRRLLRWDGYPEEIPTRDKKYIWKNDTIKWYVKDPLKFLRTVGSEDQAHARLDDIVDATSRNAITKSNLIEIVRTSNREMQVTEEELKETVSVDKIIEGRERIKNDIGSQSLNICEEYGIGIHTKGYLITSIVYVDSVKVTVEDRMISERERIAERYRSEGQGEYQKIMGSLTREQDKVMSEAYKKAQEIRGKAEAEAVKIYAETYNKDPEFYSFLKSLEVYTQSFKAENTRLLLGTDNELLKYLKSAGEVE